VVQLPGSFSSQSVIKAQLAQLAQLVVVDASVIDVNDVIDVIGSNRVSNGDPTARCRKPTTINTIY